MSICRSLTLLLIALFSLLSLPATAQEEDPGKALLIHLAEAPASKVEEAVNAIVSSGDERARGWLEAYGNNRLSRVKDTGQVVLVLNNRGRDWEIADPLTGENMGEMSRRELDRVAINNRIRGQLEGILAMLDLNAKDPDVREASAQDMMGKVDASLVEPLEAQLAKEEDAAVRNRIEEALAIYRVGEGNLEAVDVLAGSLHPRARAALNEAVRGDNEAL
ncbi:MAG TPA: urea ABC transporter permease subunit UrtB, partial [Marinobacter adhaerens]|nr:urea ABC transporter permease subunit UrtB [Marinobacter adhaerens]